MNKRVHPSTGLVMLGLLLTPTHGAFAADSTAVAAERDALDEVVVTAPRSREPLKVVTDPKAPRQPVPAHDGADYLKNIPGFSVIRKGGTDGDPVFRGMAGSRLNILLDGESILGGCPMRMDPPTAYVFPAAYDRITVLKGPQSVQYGPGNSAGVVLFERDVKRLHKATAHLDGALTVGSFGRHDERVDALAGNTNGYARFTGTNSHTGDYKDGLGQLVHSFYTRSSGNVAFGITPSDDTRIELTAAKSDGKAAYADRAMDGAKFARDNIGLKFTTEHLSPLVQKLEGQLYYNYIDHVMDNYSLRTFSPTVMMPNPSVSNPDRKTTGGKLATTLALGDTTDATIGFDFQTNSHRSRMSMNQIMMPYQMKARTQDALFSDYGLFGEITHDVSDYDRLLAGIRGDRWRAEDQRAVVQLGMMGSVANPTAGAVRTETLGSGFLRYEHDLAATPATLYIGLGRTVRFPDYWEMIYKESLTTVSAFNIRPEKTTQLDAGFNYNGRTVSASLSGFYSKIKDYILIQSGVAKGLRTTNVARNIDATTWGGELSAAWILAENWKVDGSMSYTHGANDTDNIALGQMPPLEGTIGLNYDDKTYSAGALLRMAAAQNRFALNQGNIVGQDLGRSSGFSVLSLHAGWKPAKDIQITAGVDNLLDRVYAEHLSRAGSLVPGYTTTTRVNEMGRSLWVSANFSF
jgi:iron complex outermembrane receptor protein